MLWTDDESRRFVAQEYPWFLDTFNDYTYAIQRADAIRYFVLYHYGGIYIDLDIGCLRPLDPLLVHPVILPKTIPVGVSNDLMFSEKGHPFLAQTIHNLVTFDHNWILNYPTVMFSTGPMFLSAQYGIFNSAHPTEDPVRILPKSLYGKNAKEGEAPHSFFSHFYGSSWHADDAAFIGFLGTWGKGLLWIGVLVLIIGMVRMMWPGKQRRYGLRMGGYDVLLPRLSISSRSGRWHLHLPRPTMGTAGVSSPNGPEESLPHSPVDSEGVPVLHFDMRPSSPASSDTSDNFAGRVASPLVDAFRRVRNRVASSITPIPEEIPRTPLRPRRRNNRGVLFFLPAIFTQSQDIELGSPSGSYHRVPDSPTHRPLSRGPAVPEKQRLAELDTATSENITLGDPPAEGVSHSRRSPSHVNQPLVDLGDDVSQPQSRSRSTSHPRDSL